MKLLVILPLVACKAISPPPMIAMHADTSAAPRESTTLMVILGFAGTVLGGGGWGFAFRGEHQVTNRNAFGLELTAGFGDEASRNKSPEKRKLFGIRGYGRITPRSHDWIAGTYSVGLLALDTGLVNVTVHAGTAVSYVNNSASPVLQVGLAGSFILRDGESFGDPERIPEDDVFLFVDAGLVGKSDEGRLTLDAGFAGAFESGEIVIGASLGAGAQF